MALFGAARQARRDDKDLGKGIWRRAHDRFRRALERYHQVLEGVQDDGLYGELLPIANQMAGLLPRVRNCCVAAQSIHPTDGLDIPGGTLADVPPKPLQGRQFAGRHRTGSSPDQARRHPRL